MEKFFISSFFSSLRESTKRETNKKIRVRNSKLLILESITSLPALIPAAAHFEAAQKKNGEKTLTSVCTGFLQSINHFVAEKFKYTYARA